MPAEQVDYELPAAPGGTRPASRERGGIQSLARAAAILDAVAQHPDGITLAELSAAVGLHTSTAFHLIKTLVNLGFLALVPNSKRYRIGGRIFALAAGALDENALLALATPILEHLSAETGEAAHLAVRSKHEIVVIARTAATGLLQLSGRTGATRPAHATAIGTRLTAQTITDRRTLRREIDEVRRRGVAYDNCELDDDVRCVAVPVRDFADRCMGAMGISGSVWRLSEQTMEAKTRQLQRAADELSAQLGYGGAGPRD